MATAVNTAGPTVPATAGDHAGATAGDHAGATAGDHAGATAGATGDRADPTAGATGDRADANGRRLGALLDEAQAAVSTSANVLRDVRERYRTAHRADVARWEALRAELGRAATTTAPAVAANAGAEARTEPGAGAEPAEAASAAAGAEPAEAANAAAGAEPAEAANAAAGAEPAEAANAAAGAEPADPRSARRNGRGRTLAATERDEAVAAREVEAERATLARLELAIRSLENAWLFLDPTDDTLVDDPSSPVSAADAQMRIVEAQEAERNRLAREIHDGPAQAMSNAMFQIEVVERLLDRDERLAREELRSLREVLARELRGVRAFLSQLRPPQLADLGLVGAIREAADDVAAVLGVPVTVDLDERLDSLPEPVEVVILRVVQEALQNVRRHAAPRTVGVRAALGAGGWVVEVRDDGKGFEPEQSGVDSPRNSANPGRRSFGLQFMRERARLIGARFEVRSAPELGTVVRMVVPASTEDT
jgi:signal transduction histidine kinase